MIKWKHQIREWELYEIRVLLAEGYSIPKIAGKLGRNKTTLYRLFRNNGVAYCETKLQYVWWKSWRPLFRKDGKKKIQLHPGRVFSLREKRRRDASRRYCRIKPWGDLEKYILEKTKNAWSPKQISGRWNLETSETLSKDTIYRYVYSTHPELVSKFFRRKWKRYQHNRANKYHIMDRRMIDRRPKIIERRLHIGHWEWDTVVWIRWWSKQVILTNVERKSGYLLTKKIQRGTGECVLEATQELFTQIPHYKRKTITYDNGREFCEHRLIEYFTKTRVYFAHPYHSWERWTNENTNGLLRQFIPKKTDMQHVSHEQLEIYTHLLNHRPRERLDFLTPHEVFVGWKSCIWL